MNNQDANGSNFIPASQRPDGTWRKPRRVKEGYVPQEEVPLYESKGKQFLSRKSVLPVGLTPVHPEPKSKKPAHRPIPGLNIQEEKNKKKKNVTAMVEEVKKAVEQVKIIEPPALQPDPAKRLKNLRKRLREIEALELRIKSGDTKNMEKEQLEKVTRKNEVLKEINIIEKILVL